MGRGWVGVITTMTAFSCALYVLVLYYHIYSNARRGLFLKLALKFVKYEVPNQIALNRTTQSQTKACITKLSCEICTVLRYYAAQSGNSSPMFQDKGKKIPKERTKNE